MFDPPNVMAAATVHLCLYTELAQRAQQGEPLGHLSRKAQASLIESLKAVESVTGPLDGDKGVEFLRRFCTVTNYLVESDQEFICPVFIQRNPDIDFRKREERGGDIRVYNHRLRKIPATAMQMGLELNPEKFHNADGSPMDRMMTNRVMMLIVNVDSALYQPDRQHYAYTEGLIQNAAAVLNKFTEEQITMTCRRLAMNRAHPILAGISAEKVLAEFDSFAQKLK